MTIHGEKIEEGGVEFDGIPFARQRLVGYFHARGHAVTRDLVELDPAVIPLETDSGSQAETDHRKAFAAIDPRTGETTAVAVVSESDGEGAAKIEALVANPEKPVLLGELQRFVGAALHLTDPDAPVARLDMKHATTNIPEDQLGQVAGKAKDRPDYTFMPIGPARIHTGLKAA